MFITRKQYELDLRKARAEGRKEAFQRIRQEERIHNVEDCMYKIERDIYGNMDRMEKEIKRWNEKMGRMERSNETIKTFEPCDCECKAERKEK